jgi:tetratricopeptide (TPR) repeat protein
MSPADHDDASGSLAIHVVDPSGREVPGMVHVGLFRAGQEPGRGPQRDGLCDSSGYCSFSGLSPGSYSVAVSVAGYLTQRYDVDMLHADQQQVTVQLRRASGNAGSGGATVSLQQLGVPDKARRKFEKGYGLYQHNDYKGAVKQFQEALEVDPNYVIAQNHLGLAWWKLEAFDNAGQWFETAMRTDPKFMPPYLHFAEMLVQRKDSTRAAAVLQQASEAAPYQGEPLFLMGKIQYDLGYYDRAELALAQALKRDTSKIPEVHLSLADVYIHLYQTARMAEQWEAYLAVAPQGIFAKAVRERLAKLKQQETAQSKAPSGE